MSLPRHFAEFLFGRSHDLFLVLQCEKGGRLSLRFLRFALVWCRHRQMGSDARAVWCELFRCFQFARTRSEIPIRKEDAPER